MNIFRIIKSIGIIFLSLLVAAIVAMLFFADFGPGETLYTRSFVATLFTALTALMLGYAFGKWWFGFLPVLFPLIVLITGILGVQLVQFDELITLLIPVIGSFAAVHLGARLSRRGRIQNK